MATLVYGINNLPGNNNGIIMIFLSKMFLCMAFLINKNINVTLLTYNILWHLYAFLTFLAFGVKFDVSLYYLHNSLTVLAAVAHSSWWLTGSLAGLTGRQA